MAVVKVTKSERGIIFVDDDGNVFTTSKVYLERFLSTDYRSKPFLMLTRMPLPASSERFPKSPVYQASTPALDEAAEEFDDSVKKDGFSKGEELTKRKKQVQDVML